MNGSSRKECTCGNVLSKVITDIAFANVLRVYTQVYGTLPRIACLLPNPFVTSLADQ